MEQNEVMNMISDIEKIISVKKCAAIGPWGGSSVCPAEMEGSKVYIKEEDIKNIKTCDCEEYLLISRSGETVINQFLNAIVKKEIVPKFVVIIKKWSVLGDIIYRYYNALNKYDIYQSVNDKSVCILIKKVYVDTKLKTDIVDRYQLVQYKISRIINIKNKIKNINIKKVELKNIKIKNIKIKRIKLKKITFKNIKKSVRNAGLKNKFIRDLYSVWRENPGVGCFMKAVLRIILERIKSNKAIILEIREDSGLEMCIYDTDKESIVKSEDNIICNTVTVVICVYNALDDVKELLTSLWNCRSFPYEIIIIDDGSEEPTKEYLEYYAGLTGCQLVRHSHSWGYTKSANDGLKRANSDYVVLLNSDTIVTSKWVEKMMEVFLKYPDTGIVGPLSNSATYQNIPHLHDFETGNWVKNELPEGFNVELMNYTIEINSDKKYPVVPVLNGFCTMISRELINKIGILDEEQFPIGYGEEVDYCLRARRAGYKLRVADDTYIFHEKSKSFGKINKKELSKKAAPYLSETYGEMYMSIGKEFERNEVLIKVRNNYKSNVSKTINAIGLVKGKKIGFVLLTRGGNGGANSVCQEVIGMRKLGFDAYVVNTSNYMNDFSNNYPELRKYTYYYKKGSIEDLYEKTKDFDILIATIFTSVAVIRDVMKMNPRIKPAYYIQDYETLFFEKEDIMYKEAYDSYTLITDNCLFAKTNWLVDTVSANHNVSVNKVTPSIDTRVYNPYLIKEKNNDGKMTIAAMVRPRTARRNPKGTLNVLKSLKQQFGDKLDIVIFGCANEELEAFQEECQFEYQNLGILKKGEVAVLLAKSDIFIDMSYYQAFGRTGLEGMCYGCIPVLPVAGGTDEYAIDNVNSIVVDTMDDACVVEAIERIIREEGKIQSMQKEAIATARKYCVLNASWSELKVLNQQYV